MDKKIKMFYQKYKIPTIIVSCVLLIGIIFVIGKSIADPNSGYLRNQMVDGLSFENADIVSENGITTFTAEVYNESGEDYELKDISIKITSDSDKETTLVGYIGEKLEKDQGKYIRASIDEELEDITNIQYTINKQ